MRHEFRLADIGEGLEEAEIVSWLVQPGDHVRRDQPLIEVMTDKSNAELPAPATGTVVEIQGAVGDMIAVGELIAVIDDAESSTEAHADHASTPEAGALANGLDNSPTDTVATSTPAPAGDPLRSPAPASDAPKSRPKASPATRKAAAERGIDLATVSGSGPGGRILLQDLDRATQPDPPIPTAEAAKPSSTSTSDTIAHASEPIAPAAGHAPPTTETPPAAAETPEPRPPTQEPSTETDGPPPDRPPTQEPSTETDGPPPDRPPTPASDMSGTVPLRGIRRAVARNMAQSWSTIPHIHAFDHIDAEPMLDLRARLKASNKPELRSTTPLTFFVAALAKALAENRHANASIDLDEETITYHPTINVGVAVATDDGLVVPVLRGADQLDFGALARNLGALVRSARSGELSREHFLGGTVTITNFGALGGEQAVPLIRPPESLILGFGSIAERPFVIDHQVVVRRTMHLVAGADHRLLDGDSTTAILSSISASLSDPLGLVL